ncbi:MAG: magnesium/cobalt transporter CorA [bacterium]
MKRYLKSLAKKTGLPPGTTMHIGPERNEPVHISLIRYDSDSAKCKTIDNLKTIKRSKEKIDWVDIRGIHDLQIMRETGSIFNIHSLILEDITNTSQLPKIEEHPQHFFILIKAISFDGAEIKLEHIALFLAPKLILSFQENTADTFSIVKDRVLNKKGKVTEKKEDYLFYTLFDYVIDTYFESLRKIDVRLSELNVEVDQAPSQSTLKNIQTLKKQILVLKRYSWYTRDIVLNLKKSESSLIAEKTDKYLTDLYDHIAHIIDISESFREELIDLSERHLSAINLRSNDIMKMLTIVTAIFMPLTFLAGIYGMNFKYMPELEWKFAYPILVLAMVALSSGLLLFFKRKKWFD